MNKLLEHKDGYEDYCLEILLQRIQMKRQQSLNLSFAHPTNFNEGEHAAYNTVIREIENVIDARNEYWKQYFGISPASFQQPN